MLSQEHLIEIMAFLTELRNFFFFFFLQLHMQYMEMPRLVGESELQLQVLTTAIATQDLSRIYDLPHSL